MFLLPPPGTPGLGLDAAACSPDGEPSRSSSGTAAKSSNRGQHAAQQLYSPVGAKDDDDDDDETPAPPPATGLCTAAARDWRSKPCPAKARVAIVVVAIAALLIVGPVKLLSLIASAAHRLTALTQRAPPRAQVPHQTPGPRAHPQVASAAQHPTGAIQQRTASAGSATAS
eukprot:2432036-Prymnesium_polylepis.1